MKGRGSKSRAVVVAGLLGFVSSTAAQPVRDLEPVDPEPTRAAPTEKTAARVLGDTLTEALYAGRFDELWSQSSPSFRRQFGSKDGLAAFARKVKNDFGTELRVGGVKVTERNGVTVYARLAVFSLYARGVEVQWTWDAAQQVTAVSARPAVGESPSPHSATVPKTALRLPVDGAWNVLWGGRTWDDNRHASVADQRYALDLLVWKKGSATFEGDGSRNEQYFCWGKAVRAPAEGVVLVADDGMRDNAPNAPAPTERIFGNHVVLDHGNGEYSLLAHLQRGSVAVKAGTRVTAGQLLGRTGNSGISTEPHLHYQLMDAPQWVKAHGLPAAFSDYTADGKPVARGEPRRGQTIVAR